MLKIAISGCNGRMGRVVTDIAEKKEGMKVVAGFDLNTVKYADYPVYADPLEFPGGCDVIIDFSNVSVTEHLPPHPHPDGDLHYRAFRGSAGPDSGGGAGNPNFPFRKYVNRYQSGDGAAEKVCFRAGGRF